MGALSVDLRKRVIAAVDEGATHAQAAARFGVSATSVGRLIARRARTGSVAPALQRHGPVPAKRDALHAWLPQRLGQAADATLAEHCAAFTEQGGTTVSVATMWRAIETLPPPTKDGSHLTSTGRRRRPGASLKQRP